MDIRAVSGPVSMFEAPAAEAVRAEPQKDLTVQWLRVSAVGKPPPIVPAFPVMDFTSSSAVQSDRGAAASCPLCVFVVSWLLCVIVSPLKLQRCCRADIRHLCCAWELAL